MKKFATTWILILSIVIAEAHSYIPEEVANRRENWIRRVDRTMEVSWNVKFVSDQVNAILYFIAMFFYIPNRVNKTTVVTFIILCCIDLIVYFDNYKTINYGSVYVWVLGIWAVLFFKIK